MAPWYGVNESKCVGHKPDLKLYIFTSPDLVKLFIVK